MVERDLAKVEVASSTLVSRSKVCKDEGGRMKDENSDSTFRLHPSSPESGGVAKW